MRIVMLVVAHVFQGMIVLDKVARRLVIVGMDLSAVEESAASFLPQQRLHLQRQTTQHVL
jgi:hypothetical protein